MNDDEIASNEIKTHLMNQAVTDVMLCSGDDEHSSHIEISFGDMKLHILVDNNELVMGLTHTLVSHQKHNAADMHQAAAVPQ
jgi:hypothetical protein